MSTATRLDELKLERLHRYLRFTVGFRGIPVYYTNQKTSYYDGKALYIIRKTDIEPYILLTPAESEIVQKAHAVHEAGHYFFDILEDYKDWLQNSRLQVGDKLKEYSVHQRLPIAYLQMFGNNALDGRMERLLGLRFPNTEVATILEFTNYNWAYSSSFCDAQRGSDKLSDFREMFGRRSNRMTDLDGWHEDVVKLINDYQHIIDEFLIATSTKTCLEAVSRFIEAVWPSVLTWIEDEEQDVPKEANAFSDDMFTDESCWADDAEMTQQLAESLLSQQTETVPSSTSLKEILESIEQEIEGDIAQVDSETSTTIQAIPTQTKSGTINNQAAVELSSHEDIRVYNQAAQSAIRQVRHLSAVLATILQEEKSATQRNTNRGRLMINRVWQGVHCDNPNIRTFNRKGKPAAKAIIEFMTDTSGSTSGPVIQTIRESLSLFLLAAQLGNIPTKAFAFQTTFTKGTTISKIKPSSAEFTQKDKARIGGLKSGASNQDVVALQYLVDDIAKESNDIKIAVMISDGAPIFEEGESESTISEIVRQANNMGIHVLCLFVGNDVSGLECAQRMYGSQNVVHAKMNLIQAMRSSITRILRQSRT